MYVCDELYSYAIDAFPVCSFMKSRTHVIRLSLLTEARFLLFFFFFFFIFEKRFKDVLCVCVCVCVHVCMYTVLAG